MASKLTMWINAHLKAKGKSPKEAQKDAGKYSSISAAKKAGSLYYTDKKGRVMIAAYAEDLSKPLPKPKETKTKIVKPEKRPKVVKTKKKKTETKKIDTVAKKPNSKTPDESSGGRAKSKVTKIVKASPGKLKRKADETDNEVGNVQLKQKGDGSKGSRVVEAGDRYRKPGQGKGRGLRGTNPEEPFSGKVKQKKKKKKK